MRSLPIVQQEQRGNPPAGSHVTVSFGASMRLSTGMACIVRYDTIGPMDLTMKATDTYRLDLCLTPRPPNARGRFLGQWQPGRFERIGEVLMCPPGETLQVRNDEQSARVQTSVVCQLHPDRVAEWFETPSRYPVPWTDSQLRSGLDLPANNVRWLLDRVAAELLNPQLATDTMIELMISQLAVALARMCGVDIDRTTSGGLTPWRLRLIDERLNDLRSPATLSDLSALCKMSVRQLTRGFRVSRGQSIGDYIAERRIEHAKSMLTTDESVKSIAYRLGYASSSSFACAFRNSTGQSPRDYRELARNATSTTVTRPI